MYTMQVDQDINCRTIGRCTFGAPIDREMNDLIPLDDDKNPINMSHHGNRNFLYARYNADLSREGLDKLGLKQIDSDEVREMDSVQYLLQLQDVGRTVGKSQVSLKHFGPFV